MAISKSTRFLTFLVIVTVLLVVGFVFFNKRTVGYVTAKEYLAQTKQDLDSIAGKIHYYQNSFIKIEQLFGQAQSAFYEISSPKTYQESVADTKSDIQDIGQVLHQIEQLQAKKKLINPPEEMAQLAHLVSDYYDTVNDSLHQLLVHEQTQLELLNISGDEYNQLLGKIDSTKDPTEFAALILQLAPLSQLIAQKMESATLPDQEMEIFRNVIRQHRLQADFFEAVAILIRTQDADFKTKYTALVTQFGQDISGLRSNISSTAQRWMDASTIKQSFVKAAQLEREISNSINEFSENGVQPVTPTPAPPSTTLSPTPTTKAKGNSQSNQPQSNKKNK